MDAHAEFERAVDPHRAEAEQQLTAQVVARLSRSGVRISGAEGSEDLENLLSAVERFELAVQIHGGDLIVDDVKSVQRGDRRVVLPPRGSNEAIAAYMGRLDEATTRLRASYGSFTARQETSSSRSDGSTNRTTRPPR